MKQSFQAPQPLILRIKKIRVIPFFVFGEVPHLFHHRALGKQDRLVPSRVLNAITLTM